VRNSARQKLVGFGFALIGVAVVSFLFKLLLTGVNTTTVALSLLVVVLGAASRYGLGPSIVASLAGMFCFNFFFLPPVGTLTIQDPQNWVALSAFLVTAVTASHLSAAARSRASEAETRREEVLKLYQLSRAIIATPDSESAMSSTAGQVVDVFGFSYCAVFVPDENDEWQKLATASVVSFIPQQAEIDKAFSTGEFTVVTPAVGESDLMDSVTYVPLKVGVRSIGVMVFISSALERNTVEAIAGLVALALERARFLREVSRTEAVRQSERLKSALLDAVTHDIRTPLTSIKASVSTLLDELKTTGEQSSALDAEGRREMLEVIDEEADRLNRFVAGLVELARIEAGEMQLQRCWGAVGDIVVAALTRAEPLTCSHRIEVSLEDDLPLVCVDPRAVAEVIYTLVDNAAKYSPLESVIRVAAYRTGSDMLTLSVEDQGRGIPAGLREQVFEKFFRATETVRSGEKQPAGIGMGLAIARGIVEAHGGRIWIEEGPERRGARFVFSLPIGADKEVAAQRSSVIDDPKTADPR
jgi:two-component system, OmpR family, sensor histidine kinase KdpD